MPITAKNRRNKPHPRCQPGFSLVELMIGITLSLIIMAGLSTVFIQSSQARAELERNNRQIESGRYAVSLLTEDLRMAGYFSTFDPYRNIILPNAPPLAGIIAMPDPCNTTLSGTSSSWINSYFYHIYGVDNVAAATIPGCLADVKPGTDILVIRRLSNCVAGPTADAGCDAVIAGVPYFQASSCNGFTELAANTGSATDYMAGFVLNTITTAVVMNKHTLDCIAEAPYSRYFVRIYFVANNNIGSDGVPTLKRAELTGNRFTIVPLVEGIENMQFEYGVDSGTDGVVDAYTADPGLYAACLGTACVANWLRTYSVRMNILARNTDVSLNHIDAKSYVLGKKMDGTDNVFGPFGDGYKRHVYNSTVRLDNPAGRSLP